MSEDETLIKVRVVPKSSRPRVEEMPDGGYKVFVSSAPEKGKANAQVITALASHLGVRKSALEIVSGLRSRDKVIRTLE